jgi:HAD superfamily hydrolase (TIGR01509 family)
VIRGIIFDFDGLIVDTEWSVYQSWVGIYELYGVALPFDQWAKIIGTSSLEHFDPFDVLERQVGQALDRQKLHQKRWGRELEMVAAQPILPGVEEILNSAKMLNLKLGLASSSNREWVAGNLTRLGLLEYFDVIHTSDDVEFTKPDPTLYLLTLQSLDLSPHEAIVLEDSPNGVSAAKDAGIFTIAVPNPLTANLNLDRADLILPSLAELTLVDLIQAVEKRERAGRS